MNTSRQLRDDAKSIWNAAVDAVRSERLVADSIRRTGDQLTICDHSFSLADVGRIAVVGAGKAGAGMAAAVEKALGKDVVQEKVTGWINVPADCLRILDKIKLHAGRPAGVNEPRQEGVIGSEQILKIVGELTAADLCLVLISGGGSALLTAPQPPLTLQDKQATTRYLMNHGATIQELNTVRKRLSSIKGGGLARSSRAGQLVSLIISDVVGDPLNIIASGPTTHDSTTHQQALEVLSRFGARPPEVPQGVFEFLDAEVAADRDNMPFPGNVTNHIIGNNETALKAAEAKARYLGYQVVSLGSDNCGEASSEGRDLARRCRELRDNPSLTKPTCLLSGGEPVVHLANTPQPRQGGRNQELVLAGLDELKNDGMSRIVLLSGGTDGEDGPTDAAGAYADSELLAVALRENEEMNSYLRMNDSYTFFDRVGGLLKTGPTHTNVMDVRVALVGN